MTSSLVGSEMCIRDSVHRALSALCGCATIGLNVIGVGLQMLEAASCQSAVSYTHLTLPTICSV
eukprot:9169872-Prorocentrum_lima.AAC.1